MRRIYDILKRLVEKIPADYIIDYGTSGNWIYKKYSDGTYDAVSATAFTSGTLTMTQIGSSAMYSSQSLTLPLPSIGITQVIHANFEQLTNSYTVNIAKNNIVGTTVRYQVNKAGSSTSAVHFTSHIYGTWA